MQKIEYFFVKNDRMRAMRAAIREFPGMRGLLKRDSDMRDRSILEAYAVMTGMPTAGAAQAWQQCVSGGGANVVAAWCSAHRPHVAQYVPAGGEFPADMRIGVYVTGAHKYALSCVVTEHVRIMRWCEGKLIPTTTHSRPKWGGVVIYQPTGGE